MMEKPVLPTAIINKYHYSQTQPTKNSTFFLADPVNVKFNPY